MTSLSRCVVLIGFSAVLAGPGGCSAVAPSEAGSASHENPLIVIADPNVRIDERVAAIEQATRLAREGALDAPALRERLRTFVWGVKFPVELRRAGVRALLTDPDPEVEPELKQIVRLRLPTEPSLTIVREICKITGERMWVEATPAAVRSFARPVPGIADEERPEMACLRALHPGTSVEEVVFSVFMDPPEESAPPGVPWRARTRFDAWDLLARLDADATFIRRVLRDPPPEAEEDPLLGAIRASVDDLRAVPRTAEELRWVASLRSGEDPRDAAWWEASSEAIRSVRAPGAAWLEVRHAEPIRWAARHRPELLTLSRDELLDRLRSRLDGRAVHRRTARRQGLPPLRDRLSEREEELRWADILAILVIDEALADPEVVRALFVQVGMDHEDRSTEYGGVLGAADDRGFVAVLYPPRPGARKGDTQFVASDDMIEQSGRSLAHYHFHAQKRRNPEFAGPSPGDLAYAARYRRSCLVLTSLQTDLLGADYYQPGGVVVDLGEIRSQP